MSFSPSPCSAVSKNHGRPDVRRARHHLHQIVHALHVDARLRRRAGDDRRRTSRGSLTSARCRIVRDLEALGHDVVGDDAARVRVCQRLLQLRQIGGLQDPRLVGEHVQSGRHRRADPIDLAVVAPGEDDDVAGLVAEHALEVIRAGVDLELPGGRPFRRGGCSAAMRARCSRQVRAERGVDVARAGRRPDTSPSGPARRGSGRGRGSSGARRAWIGCSPARRRFPRPR